MWIVVSHFDCDGIIFSYRCEKAIYPHGLVVYQPRIYTPVLPDSETILSNQRAVCLASYIEESGIVLCSHVLVNTRAQQVIITLQEVRSSILV